MDVEKGIRDFRAQFETLYRDFGAVNVADLDGVVTVDASIGDTTTATTAKVHLLPKGGVLCFETQDWMPRPELSILQRTTYAAARTFDALLVLPAAENKRDRALELRLVEKQHLSGVVAWGDAAGVTTVCSSGALTVQGAAGRHQAKRSSPSGPRRCVVSARAEHAGASNASCTSAERKGSHLDRKGRLPDRRRCSGCWLPRNDF